MTRLQFWCLASFLAGMVTVYLGLYPGNEDATSSPLHRRGVRCMRAVFSIIVVACCIGTLAILLGGCQALATLTAPAQTDDQLQAACAAKQGRWWAFSDPTTGAISEGCAPFELPSP